MRAEIPGVGGEATILFGVILFGDSITVINAVGVGVTVAGILLYNFYRVRTASADEGGGVALSLHLALLWFV